jgi:hypothetical protein
VKRTRTLKLDYNTAIKLIKKTSREFKLKNIEYGKGSFIESPKKSEEGYKILIDPWIIPEEKQIDIMNFFKSLDYETGYIHREWGTFIMIF